MTGKILLMAITATFVIGTLVAGTTVFAAHQPSHTADGTGNSGAIHAQQDAIDALEAQVATLQGQVAALESQNTQLIKLLDFILVDTPNIGDLTIRTTASDIIFEPGGTGEVMVEGDLMAMQDATIMGTTELEGDTMMMQDATVMGTTELEGDTMMMQDATVMGQAMVEGDLMAMDDAQVSGLFSLTGQAIDNDVAGGVITPTNNFITITGSGPVSHIAPLAVGTQLTITFQPTGPLGLENCQTSVCGALSGESNIFLETNLGGIQFFAGETITLATDGTFWYEEARSNTPFVYLHENEASIGMSGSFEFLTCQTGDSAISATGTLPTGVEIEQVRQFGDGVGVRFDNTSGSPQIFTVFAVCISTSDIAALP